MEGAHGSLLDRGSGLRFRLSRGSRQDNAPPPRLPKDVNVQIFETHEFAALHGKGDFAARMDLEVRETLPDHWVCPRSSHGGKTVTEKRRQRIGP